MKFNWFSSLQPLVRLEKQRSHLSEMNLPPWLINTFDAPIPQKQVLLMDLPLLVVDFETSGLNVDNDMILSIGMVEIHQLTIYLESAEHLYVSQPASVKAETVVINHILPQTLAAGKPLLSALQRLLIKGRGKIFLAHGSGIEQQFLQKKMAELIDDLPPLPIVWLDTLMIEKSRLINVSQTRQDYRLSHIRQEKGLPDYPAHNALCDAVATAELFLVQLTEIFDVMPPQLGAIYHRSLTGESK